MNGKMQTSCVVQCAVQLAHTLNLHVICSSSGDENQEQDHARFDEETRENALIFYSQLLGGGEGKAVATTSSSRSSSFAHAESWKEELFTSFVRQLEVLSSLESSTVLLTKLLRVALSPQSQSQRQSPPPPLLGKSRLVGLFERILRYKFASKKCVLSSLVAVTAEHPANSRNTNMNQPLEISVKLRILQQDKHEEIRDLATTLLSLIKLDASADSFSTIDLTKFIQNHRLETVSLFLNELFNIAVKCKQDVQKTLLKKVREEPPPPPC